MPFARTHSRLTAPHGMQSRWGVVLAGGDGERLKPLTKIICGDERPKQFCPLFEGQTLLGRTLRRLQYSIQRERVLVSLTAHQHQWYEEESALAAEMRIVQPQNRGTAPPIAVSLMSIARIDPDAVVGIFPSDHHYGNEALFATQLESAFAHAEAHPDIAVLLGARPASAEVGYGWIEPGSPVETGGELYRVHGFQEKPAARIARKLLRQGSLWNTFVMVGRVRAFLEMLGSALPGLASALGRASLWNGTETYVDRALYEEMPAFDFSRQVLSAEVDRLLVQRLGEVGWNDLGDPERVLEIASAAGLEPAWATEWNRINSKRKPVKRMETTPRCSDVLSPLSGMASA